MQIEFENEYGMSTERVLGTSQQVYHVGVLFVLNVCASEDGTFL